MYQSLTKMKIKKLKPNYNKTEINLTKQRKAENHSTKRKRKTKP